MSRPQALAKLQVGPSDSGLRCTTQVVLLKQVCICAFPTDVQTPWPLLQCWEWAHVPYGGQLAPMSAVEEQRSQSFLPVTSALSVLEVAVFVRSPFAKHKSNLCNVCPGNILSPRSILSFALHLKCQLLKCEWLLAKWEKLLKVWGWEMHTGGCGAVAVCILVTITATDTLV